MKLRIIPLAILGFAALDVGSLILAGSWLGFGLTVALLIFGGILGSRLVRRGGANLATLVRGGQVDSKLMSEGTADGIAFGLAGLLFIMPGFFSDVIAGLILLPSLRKSLSRWIERHLVRITPPMRPSHGGGPVIEGEATVIEERLP
jgi:UPF0716 protein FxsA